MFFVCGVTEDLAVLGFKFPSKEDFQWLWICGLQPKVCGGCFCFWLWCWALSFLKCWVSMSSQASDSYNTKGPGVIMLFSALNFPVYPIKVHASNSITPVLSSHGQVQQLDSLSLPSPLNLIMCYQENLCTACSCPSCSPEWSGCLTWLVDRVELMEPGVMTQGC